MMKILLSFSAYLLLNSYAFSQISNGRIAYFPLNNSFTDVSPSNISGTNYGAGFGEDRNGTANFAMNLSGSEYYEFNNNLAKPVFPFSLSMWVNLDEIPSNNTQLYVSDNNPSNFYGFSLVSKANTGNPVIGFYSGLGTGPSNRISFASDTPLQSGTWHHIVAVVEAHDNMKIYVDCDNTTGTYSGTGSQTMLYSNFPSRIGSYAGYPNENTDGRIDEVMIWNRALSASEIVELCESTAHIEENQKMLTATIAPNPTHDLVEITTNIIGNYEVTVYDPAGKLVISENYTNQEKLTLDVMNLDSQVYFVQIQSATEKTTVRLVKQ